MAANLGLFPFDNLSNIYLSNSGFYVEAGIIVDALGGADSITGVLPLGFANNNSIINYGRILTRIGNDTIEGTYNGGSLTGGIYNFGVINTGGGADRIIGNGNYRTGIRNEGALLTGMGRDTITGTNTRGAAIVNLGTIFTGDDNDTVSGRTEAGNGIENIGTINTGSGDDAIIGSKNSYEGGGIANLGRLLTGLGNDIITAQGGLYNLSIINTGGGNDNVLATFWSDFNGFGILNEGSLFTGNGNDVIDAGGGGFSGEGLMKLGAGRDTLKGFGTGNFYGGSGIDRILIRQGTYIVSGTSISYSRDGLTGIGPAMNVNEFERIGGVNGGLFTFSDGTLTVNSDGVATFAA